MKVGGCVVEMKGKGEGDGGYDGERMKLGTGGGRVNTTGS